MNLSDIFGKEFAISGLTLVLLVAVLLLIVVAAGTYIATLNKKLKNATTPKFGFAGKPLYQFFAVLFLAASIPLGYVAIQQQIHYDQLAEEQVEVKINYTEVSRKNDNVTLAFSAVPYIENVAWGDKTYDIFWTFEGTETKTLFEFEKNEDNPSNLIVTLKKGKYSVKAIMNYEDKSEEVIKEIQIN